ncbi:MAG TPA: HEAT repeat domain-containing protein, partial [Tepidisphaeraceae bacterium]|nr:HEAT repeat domain-containing protein [Tepidisphaeraceae bacterium]
IKLGPDGALYVADFYNRIIGHYEVDLHHPGRDKRRGRIWRIVYKGAGATPAASSFDLTKQTVQQVVEDLASPNLTIRTLAMNRLADTIGQPAVAPLKDAASNPKNAVQKVHALWSLYRLNALDAEAVRAAASDREAIVRIHAMRIIGEMPTWKSGERDLALAGLKDADPTVRRTAAEALGRHPQFENIRALLDAGKQADSDPFLKHVVKIALRDQWQDDATGQRISTSQWSDSDQRQLADAAMGASSPQAAALLLKHVRNASESHEALAKYVRTIARAVPENQVDELAGFISEKFADDVDLQLASFKSVIDGLAQRGLKPADATKRWGEGLAEKIIGEQSQNQDVWVYLPAPGATDSKNPWAVQMRPSADGNPSAPFFSSLVRGETLTGIARSPTFPLPPSLSFYLAGHNGPPPRKFPVKNVVRLRDARTNEVLAEQAPPRNDVAQHVTWDLSRFPGRQGYFEATDGDNGKMYAWLAFGRFDPPVISIPAGGPRLVAAIQIVDSLRLTSLAGAVEKVLSNRSGETEVRVAAAKALAGLGASSHIPALGAVVRDAGASDSVRETAANAVGSVDSPQAASALVEAVRAAPMRLQISLAKALASTPTGAGALLKAISDGKASARLLQDVNVVERLRIAKVENLDARVAELTKAIPPGDAALQMLIDRRALAFDPRKADVSRGKGVFQKNCMACHMVGGQGSHVGPQLDGIGARGAPRLCEDILDPSRNVDAAFRYSTFVLSDGNVIAGIPRREEGQTITVADSTGKEVTIDKPKITRRVESQLSLMPSNFGEVIPPADFNDLLSYLLSTRQ